MIATRIVRPVLPKPADMAPQSIPEPPPRPMPTPPPMPGVPRVVRYDDVLLAVCQELRIIPEMVHDHNRHPHKVLARDVVVYTCRHMTRLSYPEIAEKMERTNHSTSIDQYARMERRLAVYEAVDDGRSVGQVVEAVRARVEAVVREPIKIRAIV